MSETENSYRSPDGFKISAELDLTKFLNHPNEDRFAGEYVHVFPDNENRELRIYRSIGEAGSPKIMTRVPGSASLMPADGAIDPTNFYLTGGHGETVLTMLRCFRNETTADELRLTWYGVNNSTVIDVSDVDNETLILNYRTGSGREEEITMNDAYTRPSHMMAAGDGYNFR